MVDDGSSIVCDHKAAHSGRGGPSTGRRLDPDPRCRTVLGRLAALFQLCEEGRVCAAREDAFLVEQCEEAGARGAECREDVGVGNRGGVEGVAWQTLPLVFFLGGMEDHLVEHRLRKVAHLRLRPAEVQGGAGGVASP